MKHTIKKPALPSIAGRYCVRIDKDSQITNDADLGGIETEKNPKYRTSS